MRFLRSWLAEIGFLPFILTAANLAAWWIVSAVQAQTPEPGPAWQAQLQTDGPYGTAAGELWRVTDAANTCYLVYFRGGASDQRQVQLSCVPGGRAR